LELFERYAQQRLAEKRKRRDTIEQDRKIIKLFASFVGATKAVSALTQIEVREWRDTVAALPPKFASAKAYQGLAIREAAAKAQAAGMKRMSPMTVNKYMSTVSPFLAWCVRNAFAERNPCEGLFYDLQKGRNPRPPFSSDQLRQILASPLFTGFEGDGKEHVTGTTHARDWRFWIPLVCLFTGARISEIAQLNVCDIDQEGGIPFITIRHDEAAGQSTKSARSRIAPIHSKLVALGFLSFVEGRRAAGAGAGRLFPELLPNSRGNVGATASRFWRDFLRRIGVKSGSDGYGSHSFRHLLADRLRTAGYLNEEIKVALGHSQKSVTSAYGQLAEGTAKRLGRMIAKIPFEEVDHLIK
jgi:integrase